MKIGYFGKLPSYGDFIQRNVAPDLIDHWDNWILRCLEDSKVQLGDDWKSIYFNSPIWRFTIHGGTLHQHCVSGLVMPSVDSAGRCYPFTIFCQAERALNVISFSNKLDALHQQTEEFMLNLLPQKRPDLDGITGQIQQFYDKFEEWTCEPANIQQSSVSAEIFRVMSTELQSLPNSTEGFIDKLLAHQGLRLSIFSTLDTQDIHGQTRYYDGLPPADCFAKMMQGV